MASSSNRNTLQADAAQILNAQAAACRLLERTKAEHRATMSLSRDELSALAQQMLAVATIAERHHLARATVGSLAPDAFGEPVQ